MRSRSRCGAASQDAHGQGRGVPRPRLHLSLDISAAFPSVNRATIFHAVSRRCPYLLGVVFGWYKSPTRHVFQGSPGNPSRDATQRHGLHHGCPLSSALLSVGLEKVLENIQHLGQHRDGAVLVGRCILGGTTRARSVQILQSAKEWFATLNLRWNATKTRVWFP